MLVVNWPRLERCIENGPPASLRVSHVSIVQTASQTTPF